MTENLTIRRGSAMAVLAVMVVSSAVTAAQTPKKPDTFSGTTVNMRPGEGETLKIDVLRWSTDADRERLIAVLSEKGDAALHGFLEAVQTHGYIWTSESLGYSLRYAHRQRLPNGGVRIVVITDRRLGTWTRGNVWQAPDVPGAPDYPFTMVELRLNRRERGEGKTSLATKVAVDHEGKTIALENYEAAPVQIKSVSRERRYQ